MNHYVISFVSGKGGVGKTVISANISYVLVNYFNKKVLLIDTALSTPDLNFILKLGKPRLNYLDLFRNNKFNEDLVPKTIITLDNIDIIPAPIKIKPIFEKFKILLDYLIEKYLEKYDYIILDTAAGLSKETYETIKSSDFVYVVTTPEIHSLYDALRTKVSVMYTGVNFSGFILNMVGMHKYQVKEKVETILREQPILEIPYDPTVQKAIKEREFVVKLKPCSPFSRKMFELAKIITKDEETYKEIESLYFGGIINKLKCLFKK